MTAALTGRAAEGKAPHSRRAAQPPAMMDVPLDTWLLFENVASHHASTEIVSRLPTGEIHRYTYADFARRAQQLMHALDALGIAQGARVATLAWNGYRHLECYFGVPCSGRALHTLNLRLAPAELGYIIGHADDRAILVDADLLPLLEQVGDDALRNVEHIVVLSEHVPETALPGVVAYEELLRGHPETYERRRLDESSICGICYTSGTTGRPKGVAYTHRSTALHAMAVAASTGMDFNASDCVLPVVPMFHANAWGVPYAATMTGAKQVFSGGALEPGPTLDLFEKEEVTVTAGVPTVWLTLADEIARRGRPKALRHIIVGGGQPPRPLIERYRTEFAIPIVQAWGMTETSPLASIAWPKHHMRGWDEERITDVARCQAGLPLPGVQISIRDELGNEVPRDGATMGELLVRGPWVVSSYLYGEGADRFTDDGWFRTGDIAIGSPEGYFVIADRSKDLIKSGGEWISSVDMEGAIMGMPEVVEAAVVAIPDPRWQERPLACLVLREGCDVTLEQLHAHLTERGFARWQLPDRMEVIDAVPRTSVGKFDKKVLRSRFAG